MVNLDCYEIFVQFFFPLVFRSSSQAGHPPGNLKEGLLCKPAGMAADPVAAARIRRTGLGVIPPSMGLAAMASLLAATNTASLAISSCIAAVPVDWERLLGKTGESVPFFLQEFKPEKAAAAPETKRGRQRAHPGSALTLHQVKMTRRAVHSPEALTAATSLHHQAICMVVSEMQKLLMITM